MNFILGNRSRDQFHRKQSILCCIEFIRLFRVQIKLVYRDVFKIVLFQSMLILLIFVFNDTKKIHRIANCSYKSKKGMQFKQFFFLLFNFNLKSLDRTFHRFKCNLSWLSVNILVYLRFLRRQNRQKKERQCIFMNIFAGQNFSLFSLVHFYWCFRKNREEVCRIIPVTTFFFVD